MASELDPDNRERLLTILSNMEMQLFLTAIEQESLESLMHHDNDSKMFHVEHGNVSEVVY